MQTEQVNFEIDSLRLAGELRVPSRSGAHPALCICHGIPAAPPDPDDRGYSLLAERFCRAGFVTLIFNFRGTGKSQGNLDLPGWSRDLRAALDFLYDRSEADRTHFCLLGFSGGAAVSVHAAAHDPRVSSLATCACPADFNSLYEEQDPRDAIEWFRQIGAVRDRDFPPSIEEWQRGFETITPINWIDRISPRPLLLVHGDADEVIPLEHARRLYRKAEEPKELKIIPGAKHRLRLDEAAMSFVLEWLKARC